MLIRQIEDSRGDLVDVEYYCSTVCAPADAGRWPGGIETDSAKFCTGCREFIGKGLQDIDVLSSHGVLTINSDGRIINIEYWCADDGSCDCRGDFAQYESIVPDESQVHDGEVDILNCRLVHESGQVEPEVTW